MFEKKQVVGSDNDNNKRKIEPLNPSILSKFISFYNYLVSFLGNENKKRIF